jgi:hypothetical protein
MASRAAIQVRLDRLKERLALYLDAEKAILEGAQSYQIGTRQLSRATLFRVQDEIPKLEKEIEELEIALATCSSPNKRKTVRVLFRDL